MTTKRAMIVGVNEYLDKSIKNLSGAENDAEELHEVLTKHGGFTVAKDHYLPGKLAKSEAMRRGISQLLWDTDNVDVTLFFFSGHGFRDSYGTGYLAPYDMNIRQPLVCGIDMRWLRHLALKSLNKKAVILILDCCYSGIAADAKGDAAEEAVNVPNEYFSDFADMGLEPAKKKEPTGIYAFCSSTANEASRELIKEHRLGDAEPHPHGILTFHLLEALAGAAPYKEAGDISVEALRQYFHETLTPEYPQTFQPFAARESLPGQIILARASTMKQIAAGLDKITAALESGKLQQLILAAGALSDVLAGQPNFTQALALRKRVEQELPECRTRLNDWINENRFDLLSQADAACNILSDFVKGLTFDQIADVHRSRRAMEGVLLSLARAVDEDHEPALIIPDMLGIQETPSEAAEPALRQMKRSSRSSR